MTKSLLFLAHVDESGNGLPKSAYEVLGSAIELGQQSGATLTIGLIGAEIQSAADSVASAGAAKILAVSGTEFAAPRFASDAAASEAR